MPIPMPPPPPVEGELADGEIVCRVCNLTHNKHLPICPTCKLEDRTS